MKQGLALSNVANGANDPARSEVNILQGRKSAEADANG